MKIPFFSKKKTKEIDLQPVIIKEKENTEEGKAYIAGKSGLLFQNIDAESPNLRNIDKYFNAYSNYPLVSQSINSKTEQVIQDFRIEGPQKDALMKWADKIKLKSHLRRICKNGLIAGTYWSELLKLNGVKKKGLSRLKTPITFKHLDPRTMRTYRTTKGKVLAHVQEVNNNKIYWGTKPKNVYAKKGGTLEKMFCWRYNPIGDDKYGTSLIHSCLSMLETKDQMEADMKDVVKRYIAPIIHAQIGNDLHPADSDTVEAMESKLENIYTDTEYATNHLVEFNVLDLKNKGVDFNPVLGHVDSQILVGMENYTKLANDMVGKNNNGERGDEIKLREGGRNIRAIQDELASAIEEQVFYYMTGNYKNKLVFEAVEERAFELEVEILTTLVKNGILTPKKANTLLPDQFRDKIPKGLLSELTQKSDIGRDQKVPPDEKVKDNPNNPTKSTNIKDDKRVDKRDTTIKKNAKKKPQTVKTDKMM